MELLLSVVIGVLFGGGIYLVLRARTFALVLGTALISYAVNLFLFATGRVVVDSAPLTDQALRHYPDPLPQALVLTAIVIGFGMTALLIVLALRALVEHGTDHVDGRKDGSH